MVYNADKHPQWDQYAIEPKVEVLNVNCSIKEVVFKLFLPLLARETKLSISELTSG